MANQHRPLNIKADLLNEILDEPVFEPQPELHPTPSPELVLSPEEIENQLLQLRPELQFQIGPCPFTLQPKPAPENELEYQQQLIIRPELVKDLTLVLQYQGPKLTPNTEAELVTKIMSHMNQAYKEAAEQLGMNVTQHSDGELSLTMNGKPLDCAQRLALENKMQACFNERAACDNLVLVHNGNIPMLERLLDLQQEQNPAMNPTASAKPYPSPTPYRTRCTPTGS